MLTGHKVQSFLLGPVQSWQELSHDLHICEFKSLSFELNLFIKLKIF